MRMLRLAPLLAALWAASAAAAPVRRLEVLVLLYTRSFAHTLSAPEIERLQEEIVEFADFYQTHGGDRVEFHFTLLQLDRELRRAEVSEVAPGRYYLSRENVQAELEALGFRDRVDEVVAFYAWNNANPDAAVLAYGGGAVGPDGGFLGDAGFNSIGVFAWDPGRIAQIAIHEVLHNIDDMFSRSGMADGFFNSDEMSRNMPQLLAERPGAFLPYFSDPEMRAYALREQAGREMYPWWMQRIYYAWLLERTPASAWSALKYGRMAEPRAAGAAWPLYDAVHLSQATRRVYLPVLGGRGRLVAAAGSATARLAERRYALEDFDGTPLVERAYHAGWLDIGTAPAETAVRYPGTPARTALHRRRLGEIVAPARLVTRAADGRAHFTTWAREAGWPEPGDTVRAFFSLTQGDHVLDALPGPRLHPLWAPPGSSRLHAHADSFWIAPVALLVEPRSEWGVQAQAPLEATMATPAGLRIALADRRPIRARVTARVNGRELPLELQPDESYHVVLDPLPPGLHHAEITAVREDGSSARDTVLVYARPNGWIRTPTAIDVAPGERATLAVSVRSRMGTTLRGLALPLVAIAGGRAFPFTEAPATGTYTATLPLPAGEHRITVTSLEGDFQRRVVIARVRGESRPAAEPPVAAMPGAGGPLPYAVAPRITKAPVLDGALAEWRSAPVTLGETSHLLTDSALYGGAADLAAELRFAWDDSTLYVAGRVRDDRVTEGEAWDRDRVNLVLDWRENDTPLTYGEDGEADVADWQADDYWLFFQPFWTAASPGVPRRMDRLGTHALANARLATQRTADGYTFELALPAAALPEYAPFVGHVAALQLFLTDGDAEQSTTELMWSHRWRYRADSGLAWELPRMGRLVFADELR